MKRILLLLCLGFAVSAAMVSCIEIDDSFDDALLVGKWKSGTLHYRYDFNGTGATWDLADDVSEAEAQAFSWTLEQRELTHIHVLEMGGSVPKVYTVTELSATSLKYKDDFGKTFAFVKVP